MVKYYKYAAGVWLAECDTLQAQGDKIEIENRYGQTKEIIIYNLVKKSDNGKYYYSYLEEGDTYAQRRAKQYGEWAGKNREKSYKKYNEASEGHDFLVLGEPIKVGHHSEKRHRALLQRNDNRIRKSLELREKAEEQESRRDYWENKAEEINLSSPESLSYYTDKLEEAIKIHQGLKNGTIEKKYSAQTAYANQKVKTLKKKVELANLLWGD